MMLEKSLQTALKLFGIEIFQAIDSHEVFFADGPIVVTRISQQELVAMKPGTVPRQKELAWYIELRDIWEGRINVCYQ